MKICFFLCLVDSTTQTANMRFDELEVIQLIPVIIEQLRLGHVSESEKESLEKVFGDLWSLMVTEAKRSDDDEMNPILKTIIKSEEVRLGKRDITKQIDNDIYKNSIRRVYRGDPKRSAAPYISFDDERKLLSPKQRILNIAAAIIHKENLKEMSKAKLKKTPKRKNERRRNEKNPLGIVTLRKRNRKPYIERVFNMNRMKRSLISLGRDLLDMKAIVNQVNQYELEETDGQMANDDKGYFDQQFDDDYNDDDDYTDENVQQDGNWNYDDLFAGEFMARGNYGDDYENGSVMEFINLAKQRDRRQQNSNEDGDDDDYDE